MQCRYCLATDPENDLIDPCKCQGSLKFVHQKCLFEWVQKSNKTLALCSINNPINPIYEDGISMPVYTLDCEICKSEIKCYHIYQNTLANSLINTLKLSFSDYKNYPLLLLHFISLYYIMNEVQFVIYYLCQLVYKPFKTKMLMKFANETWLFIAVLWFTNDILKFYSNIYWEQRGVLIKFVSNKSEGVEKECLNGISKDDLISAMS